MTPKWIPVCLLILPLALAACGDSTKTTASASVASTTVAGSASRQKYTKCLADHGVTLPNRNGGQPPGAGAAPDGAAPDGAAPDGAAPGQGPGEGQGPAGFDSAAFQKARAACESLRPAGGFGGGAGGGGFNSQAFDAYRSCLKDHGIELPARRTPGASTTTEPAGVTTTTIDRNSPAFQAAQQACEALRPQGGPGSGTGAGTGGGTPASIVGGDTTTTVAG